MKDIEFRGKPEFSKKWVYGDLLTSSNGDLFYIIEKIEDNKYFMKNSDPILVDPETVGQYIGKKDINDKKMYERDYISINLNKKWIFKIIYRQEFAGYIGINIVDDNHDIILSFNNDEIIGNEVDNPEMMEK